MLIKLDFCETELCNQDEIESSFKLIINNCSYIYTYLNSNNNNSSKISIYLNFNIIIIINIFPLMLIN